MWNSYQDTDHYYRPSVLAGGWYNQALTPVLGLQSSPLSPWPWLSQPTFCGASRTNSSLCRPHSFEGNSVMPSDSSLAGCCTYYSSWTTVCKGSQSVTVSLGAGRRWSRAILLFSFSPNWGLLEKKKKQDTRPLLRDHPNSLTESLPLSLLSTWNLRRG